MSLDQQLEQKFSCPKCNHNQGMADRFAATGTGFSKFFDIQHKKYVTLSCTNCGYTEMYNPEFLEGKDNLSDFLDFIFGG